MPSSATQTEQQNNSLGVVVDNHRQFPSEWFSCLYSHPRLSSLSLPSLSDITQALTILSRIPSPILLRLADYDITQQRELLPVHIRVRANIDPGTFAIPPLL